jgi:hypothetical protein
MERVRPVETSLFGGVVVLVEGDQVGTEMLFAHDPASKIV